MFCFSESQQNLKVPSAACVISLQSQKITFFSNTYKRLLILITNLRNVFIEGCYRSSLPAFVRRYAEPLSPLPYLFRNCLFSVFLSPRLNAPYSRLTSPKFHLLPLPRAPGPVPKSKQWELLHFYTFLLKGKRINSQNLTRQHSMLGLKTFANRFPPPLFNFLIF